MKVLFHLAGRACVGNARRLKVQLNVENILDRLPSRLRPQCA
jgi:hypothetical protein